MRSKEYKGTPFMQRRMLERFSTTLGTMVLVLMAGTSSGEAPGKFGTPNRDGARRMSIKTDNSFTKITTPTSW